MAQADHLAIFKASYDLCLHLEQVVGRFSRSHRFELGSETRASARRALGLVVRAWRALSAIVAQRQLPLLGRAGRAEDEGSPGGLLALRSSRTELRRRPYH